MPKPMLKNPKAQNQTDTVLSITPCQDQKQSTYPVNKMKIDRLLRKTRSKEYMNALHKLDAGGHVHNQAQVNDIINTIRNEFPEIEISDILLGFVSICYLGAPYEVHTLSISGEIIEHYKSGERLPGELEKARSLAIRGGYEYIEVYTDCCRAISSNGSVSVISF